MREVLDKLKGAHYMVSKVVRKEKNRKPAPPFTTSTLQQDAYRKLNFTARKTMMVAQQLYEGLDLGKEGTSGLVTYIRTDSTRVSASAREEAQKYITERFGAQYSQGEPRSGAKGRAGPGWPQEAIGQLHAREPEQIKGYLTNDSTNSTS